MKKFAILFGLAVSPFFTFAQADKYCGTTEMHRKFLLEHPELVEEIIKREQVNFEERKAHQSTLSNSASRQSGTVYVIPVVFHIVHNYGPENISDAQVLSAVDILNEDFRKLNNDTHQIISEFKGIAADCEIEFRLAGKDPNGNCTNGIDRIVSLATYNAGDNAKLNQWDPKKYLNIWVVNSIGSSGVAGYAIFPSYAQSAPHRDGIVILHDYVGRIGTGSSFRSRALTHEVGHSLGLPHTWGSNNNPGEKCGDEGISDTPLTKGWTTCVPDGSVCEAGKKENVQNFMEYSYCCRMFTQGQKYEMRRILSLSTAGRNNLWTSANRTVTGTDVPAVLCPPKAEFLSATSVCEKTGIQLYDKSWRGAASSWKWIIPGSDSGTYTSRNPLVRFSSPGTYDVTLVASNSGGNDTLKRKDYLKILPGIAWYGTPFADGFERSYLFEGWYEENGPGDSIKWDVSTAGYSGKSAKLENFAAKGYGVSHSLVTPRLDLTRTLEASLKYKVAYAVRRTQNYDRLSIYYSLDCGYNWTMLNSYPSSPSNSNPGAATINNNGLWEGAFTPTKPSNWKSFSEKLPSTVLGKTPVIFKFEFYNGYGGNNFYLDDVEISGVTGIEEEPLSWLNLNIFPNPSAGSSTISFTTTGPEKVTIELVDITGRRVKSLMADQKLVPGEHRINTDIPVKGLYFVKLRIGQEELTRKLVVN
jgi:PKD repeat protein